MELIKLRSSYAFKELSSARCFICCVISGLLTGICCALPDIWFLCFISLTPFAFVMLCVKHSAKRQFFLSLTFFVCYYTPVLLWLYSLSAVLVGSFSPFLSALIMTGALILVLLVVCSVASLCLLPFKWLSRPSVAGVIMFVSFFALGEFVIAHIGALAFPWVRLGNSALACLPFVQSAALFGNLFVGMVILAVASLFALALFDLSNKKKQTVYTLSALLLIMLNFIYGLIAMPIKTASVTTSEGTSKQEVLLVQGNYSDAKKWREDILSTYIQYETLTLNSLTPDTRLVVWPETALTVNLYSYPWLQNNLKNLATNNNITLVTGATDTVSSEDGMHHYNALYVITPDGQISKPYYKQALVPVGEFIPFKDVIEAVAPWLLDIRSDSSYDQQLSPGSENIIYQTPIGSLSGIICYESIIPHIVRGQSAMGSELLVMITNDSWFGTSSALNQHLAHAQMRAVENGKYLVRAGNTGITAIITPCGEIEYQLDIEQADALLGNIYTVKSRTLYSYIGDVILLPGLMLAIGIGAYNLYKYIKPRKTV